MKSIFIVLISLLIASILSSKYTELQMHKLYNIETKGEDFSYFKFSLKNIQTIPNEITIETKLLKTNSTTIPILGIHYEPIKLNNYEHLFKAEIGKPIILNREFIKSALQKRHEIYFAVYSPNSQYSLKIVPSGDINSKTIFVQIPTSNPNPAPTAKPTPTVAQAPNTKTQNPPPIKVTPPPIPKIPNVRTLAEENNPLLDDNITDFNNTETRMQFYAADGVGGLFVAFILIFVSLIGVGIMMNIYVHTTALVEQPLKLGKIEA